ncbi:HK97-gp10 family putative phage morphogenesis protein [Alteraurantiacibacter palmitatis]|uniref:HK97-gp10 family putative phage morphogenesis protein n=1 Tax=Alteraurantiacibacter palmitatis TaxID=2054628 RepID=A0ABV7E6G3_9SPHN
MEIALEVSGFDRIPDTLARISAALGFETMSAGAEEALQPVLERARELVPVDTGNLRDGIVIAGEDYRQAGSGAKRYNLHPASGVRQGGMIVGPLEVNEFYAWFVEFGTINMAPQPFLIPAVESEKAQVFDILGRRAGRAIMAATA